MPKYKITTIKDPRRGPDPEEIYQNVKVRSYLGYVPYCRDWSPEIIDIIKTQKELHRKTKNKTLVTKVILPKEKDLF